MKVYQPGDRLTAEEIQEIARTSGPGLVPGDLTVMAQDTPAGQHQAPMPGADFTHLAERMTSRTFLAQIRYVGPKGEEDDPDFPDARYWVREIGDITPQTAGRTGPMELLLDMNKLEEPTEEEPDPLRRHYPVRWVMATNLSEINPTDRDNESHAFGLADDSDDGAIVTVFDSQNMYGRQSYLFDKAIGSASRFCIPKTWDSAHAWFITVWWVRVELEEDNGLIVPHYKVDTDNPEVIFVWPNLHSKRHFAGYVQARNYVIGETVPQGENVLEATRIQGMWFLKQTIRWPQILPAPQVNMRRSDCQPWSGLF